MTQIQSIQKNIHETKIELSKFRRVICTDELQKLHINSAIEELLKELEELKFCLRCAINNEIKNK